MATTSNDEPGLPTGEPPISEVPTKFDEVGRRAGAALRRPAPEGGAADIARRSQRRRVATVAASGAIVVVLIGAIAVLRDGDAAPVSPSATTDGTPTVPERDTSTTSVTTTPATTTPATTTVPATPPPAVLVAPATFTPTAVARPMFVSGPVQTVGFSPDGRRIVARLGGAVSVLDAVTGEELAYHPYATFDSPFDDRISTHEDDFTLSPDGSLLFDGSALVDTATGTPAFDLGLGPLDPLLGTAGHRPAAFSSDGSTFAVGGTGHVVRLFDTSTGAARELSTGTDGVVAFVALDSNGGQLETYELRSADVGAVLESTVRVWKLATADEVLRLGEPGKRLWTPGPFSPDGSALLLGENLTGFTRPQLVDIATGETVASFGPSFAVDSFFSPDGSKVLAFGDHVVELSPGADNGDATGVAAELRVFDAATDALLVTLPAPGVLTDGYWHRGHVASAAFNPDGSRIVLAPPDGGLSATVFDVATGQQVATLDGHTGQVVSAAYSPDGSVIVTASVDGTVRLWPAP